MTPLSGVRVVEFGNLIAGPYAAMLLADLGADVIKVEPPAGDLGRRFGPYVDGESVFFLAANRGKRSVVLDLGRTEDRARALELCRTADVIVTNLRHGVMDRLGLGEEAVRRLSPAVVYAVVSAFADEGPEADRPGIDVVFQAESGMISITGHEDGPPAKTATTIGDYLAATNCALAVCAALVERAATGRGRRVDVSLRDGLIAAQAGWNALSFADGGSQPPRMGTASPFLAPNQVLATGDGLVAVAVVSDRHWEVLCAELDLPDLAAAHPTNADRMAHRSEIADRLEAALSSLTADEAVERLARAGLPVGRVRTIPEAFSAAPHMRVELVHQVLGSVTLTGSPMAFDRATALASAGPPPLGAHTAEVLAELAGAG